MGAGVTFLQGGEGLGLAKMNVGLDMRGISLFASFKLAVDVDEVRLGGEPPFQVVLRGDCWIVVRYEPST